MGVSIFEVCHTLTEERASFVLVTLTQARGSVPQDAGAKMVVTEAGLAGGTIGGGRVELAAIKRAQEILSSAEVTSPVQVTWNLQKDIGMSCGGEATFLFEHFHHTRWPIVIFGAGHVSQALNQVLATLDCQVSVVDSREEWILKLNNKRALVHPTPKDLVKTFNPQSFFLCLTMGHDFDREILLEISQHAPEAPYIGVIGSEVKAIRLKRELKELGVSEAFLQKLRIPIGLEIGSNHPSEIAISIAAELLKVRGN